MIGRVESIPRSTEGYLTIEEAKEYLGLSHMSLLRLRRSGKLKSYHPNWSRRRVLFKESELAELREVTERTEVNHG